MVSRQLATAMKNYRSKHNMTVSTFARIASIYGKSYDVHLTPTEINNYENCIHVPRALKLQTLLNTMQMDFKDLTIMKENNNDL